MAELAQPDPAVELEAHVEHIESNPARWHWLNVLDRIRDDTDVLSPMSELIEKLAESEVVSKFYSYSSMRTLCFSASSHYPWVDQGFPRVDVWNGQLQVDGAEMSLAETLTAIERALMKSETPPFFGSAVALETSLLHRNFVEMESSLSPRLELHAGWLRNQVSANGRSCSSSGTVVTFDQRENPTYWPDISTVSMVMHRYCVNGESLAEILADPSRDSRWD